MWFMTKKLKHGTGILTLYCAIICWSDRWCAAKNWSYWPKQLFLGFNLREDKQSGFQSGWRMPLHQLISYIEFSLRGRRPKGRERVLPSSFWLSSLPFYGLPRRLYWVFKVMRKALNRSTQMTQMRGTVASSGGNVVLRFWARLLTLTVPLSTQV